MHHRAPVLKSTTDTAASLVCVQGQAFKLGDEAYRININKLKSSAVLGRVPGLVC